MGEALRAVEVDHPTTEFLESGADAGGHVAARSQTGFQKDVERLACEKVNARFWMSAPGMKQREATPQRIHSPARHGAIARARRWAWFFLYRHPFTKGISTPALARLYDRDHTTVLYGIKKIDYELSRRPQGVEAGIVADIARALAPDYGAFFPRRR